MMSFCPMLQELIKRRLIIEKEINFHNKSIYDLIKGFVVVQVRIMWLKVHMSFIDCCLKFAFFAQRINLNQFRTFSVLKT